MAGETCDYHNTTTRKNGNKNQKITNISYYRNCPLLKTIIIQMEMATDKTYTKKE